jgi:predicted MFS family arabinose efflux permease
MKILLLLVSCCVFFTLYQLQALYPVLASRFQADIETAGWLNMVSLLGIVLTAPFAGRLAARMKAKSCLSGALLILAALTVATALSTQARHLLAVRLAQGTAVPFILATCLALTARAASEKERSAWIGCYVIGTIVGGGMSRFLPGLLIGRLGWQAGFLVCAALVLLVFMLTVFSRRIAAVPPAPLPPAMPGKRIFLRAFSDRNLQLACLLGSALLFSQSAVLVALGVHLSLPRFGLTTGQIGMVYLAFLPASLAVAFSPRLRERIPAHWLAAGLLAGFWLAQPLIGSDALPWVAAGVALFSSAAYIAQAGAARLVSRVRKVPVALASGIYLSSYYLGGAAGACLSAYAYAAGAWPGVWTLLAGSQLCAAGVLLCGMRKDVFHRKTIDRAESD